MADHPIVQRVRRALQAIEGHNGDVDAIKAHPPASSADVDRVEQQLGLVLPVGVRAFFEQVSADFDAHWALGDDAPAEAQLQEITHGSISLGLNQLTDHEQARRAWVQTYSDLLDGVPDDLDPDLRAALMPAGAHVFDDKLAFLDVGNGDLLAVDLNKAGNPVVYLDHDMGSLHGRQLASSFERFLEDWTTLGCVGPEGWILDAFLGTDGFDLSGAPAREWTTWLYGNETRTA